MPRARSKPLYETEKQWIASDPGSPNLYRFWTMRGTGRTRRQSLGTTSLDIAKQRFLEAIGDAPEGAPISSPGLVYFIQAEATKFVKIGWTSGDPLGRLSSFSTASGSPLKLLAQTVGDKKLERALHKLFGVHRQYREWFSPAPELMGFIHSLAE